MERTAEKKKRVKLLRGDLFEFSANDGRLGYGVVIIPGGVLYAVFMKTLHTDRPMVETILGDAVALVGTTMDSLFYHGRWIVIAHDVPLSSRIPFPNWKIEIDGELRTTDFEQRHHWPMRPDEVGLLDFKNSRAPIAFQKAIEALNGVGEWQDSYERLTQEYASRRVTRA